MGLPTVIADIYARLDRLEKRVQGGLGMVASSVTAAVGSAITQLTGDVTAGPGTGAQVAMIANDAVTNAKAANMAADTLKGRAHGAGTGDPTDLTANQASAVLDTATDPFLRTSAASTGSSGFYPDFVTPVLADFAWVNQGSAVVDDTGGPIYLDGTQQAGESVHLLKQATPGSTPYTVTIALLAHLPRVNYRQVGLMLRESATAKLIGLSAAFDSGYLIHVYKWNSPTSFSGTSFSSEELGAFAQLVWFRVTNDGVNLTYYWSLDGRHWIQLYQAAKNAFFTTGPDEVGFFVNAASNTGNTINPSQVLVSYEVS